MHVGLACARGCLTIDQPQQHLTTTPMLSTMSLPALMEWLSLWQGEESTGHHVMEAVLVHEVFGLHCSMYHCSVWT